MATFENLHNSGDLLAALDGSGIEAALMAGLTDIQGNIADVGTALDNAFSMMGVSLTDVNSDVLDPANFEINTATQLKYWLMGASSPEYGYIDVQGSGLDGNSPKLSHVAYVNDTYDGLTFGFDGSLSGSSTGMTINLTKLQFGDDNLMYTLLGNATLKETWDQNGNSSSSVSGSFTGMQLDILNTNTLDPSDYYHVKLGMSITTSGATLNSLLVTQDGVATPLLDVAALGVKIDSDGNLVGLDQNATLMDAMFKGNDSVSGSDDDDYIDAGEGNNKLDGGAGDDTLMAGAGNDKFTDDEGNNTIDAGDGNNSVITGNGDDDITAGSGNDKIAAGNGNNIIDAGGGNNGITTGAGDDDITSGSGNDKITAGEGHNTIDAGDGNNGVTTGAGDDSITTGSGADKITAGDGNNTIDAGDGANKVTTGNGDDTITTGNGADKIAAGEGNNTIDAGDGNNAVTTGAGDDTITTGSGADKITAGNGNNVIDAGDGANKVTTGSGDDAITTGSGADKIAAGEGNNMIEAGAGNDTVTTGGGADWINGGDGADKLKGGAGADIFMFDNIGVGGFDSVLDFSVVDDTIELDGSVFTAVVGGVTADNLLIGEGVTAAVDADDYLIFNSKTGALYYDADGSDTGSSAVQIAVLKGTLAGFGVDDFSVSV